MGVLLCLVSAAAFGAMAIFGKLAYDAGVNVPTLLLVRFTLATLLFAALLGGVRSLRPRRPGARTLVVAIALGAVGYATQAGLFFAALERLDASLLTLLLYTYPAWVVLAVIVLRLEPVSRARLLALATASAGLVLALAGGGAARIDLLGAALGLAAALTYSTYILVSHGVLARLAPMALSTFVMAGAAASVGLAGLATRSVEFGFEPVGWLWIALIAAVSTVLAVGAFFAGLARVGPPTAAILSTVEPVVTLTLAFAIFGERLSSRQLAGAALVLLAAAVAARVTSEKDEAPALVPADAPASP